MWQEERHRRIKSMLATFGQLSLDRLSEDLNVSRETIRRDFMDLEEAGELRRVRGGVVPTSNTEPPYRERTTARLREKRAVAKTAAALVKAGQTIFLDAGSTTTILAERLALLSGLTIITNSIDAAATMNSTKELQDQRNRVVLVGGDFTTSPPATYGAITVNEIARYRADFAMVSPFGLDADAGATSYMPEEAEVARAMFANAKISVVLSDYTKLGVVSRVSFASIASADCIIIDAKAEKSPHFKRLRGINGNVLTA